MHSGPPRRRRARPVGDAPVDALLARVDDVAKGWLLALLEQAPLADTPAILAADLARDGPAVCEAIIRALADDRALGRLEPGGELEPLAARAGELAGASDPEGKAAAVEALHAVVWQAIRDALVSPGPDQVAELAERLAAVIELVRAAALRGADDEPARMGEFVATRPPRAGDPDLEDRRVAPPEPDFDGRHVAPPEPDFDGRHVAPPEPQLDRQALWLDAFEEELSRAQHTGAPLSLLLAELEDADRLVAVEAPLGASAAFRRFAQALRDAVRRQDILVRESDGRAWVIATDTARSGAQALAERIATTVRDAPPWRGAPLFATIGVAVLGEDGDDAPSLIEFAEEARFAAAANGVAVVHVPPRYE